MGAYIDMQNFSQIGQGLKNFIFNGQPHILLKMGYILHYFAWISQQNVKANSTKIDMVFLPFQ